MIYDVREYGAVGDGKTMNTEAIQQAIDACHAAGGGCVLLEVGVYLTGSITLRSGVELHIEANATLLGSPDVADYPEKTNLVHINGLLPRRRNASLIFAEEAENIAITGRGTIDGNGEHFIREAETWNGWKYERIDAPTPPRVVFFAGCKNVLVRDVSMVNQPAGWSYWIHDCDKVTFQNCKIDAEVQYPNNDGIHINCCRDVTISGCFISCGDDCIIVRANSATLERNTACERVIVSNCTLRSYSGGIRIGWLNDGAIRNCIFSDIVMYDTSVGIAISMPPQSDIFDQGRESTLVEKLIFRDVIMDNIYGRPILLQCLENKEHPVTIREIDFVRLRATGLEYPYIAGNEYSHPTRIRFSDCIFTLKSEEELPDYRHHGAAAWDRKVESGPAHLTLYRADCSFDRTEFN